VHVGAVAGSVVLGVVQVCTCVLTYLQHTVYNHREK
jgi:hypothetical protein